MGIGNIDDDPDLEIIVTYDNHAIQAFKMDGVAIDASPWFTNRSGAYLGNRFDLGPIHPLGRSPGGGGPLSLSHRPSGPTRALRNGCSGQPPLPISSTWTAMAATRCLQFPTSR